MKQRLLTISVNTRYRVIFACLSASTGKVREFHVLWKVVTLQTVKLRYYCNSFNLEVAYLCYLGIGFMID